jgi:hypothetical protein
MNSHHQLGHPPQLLVFRIEGFECSTPLVVPPITEPTGHRLLHAVDLGSQNGVPGYLPLPRIRFFSPFRPECRPESEAVGRHVGYTWE